MTESMWWREFIKTLLTLPETATNPIALTSLLHAAGYYSPRHHLRRPESLRPQDVALAAYRLRFEAPNEARRVAEGWDRA